MADAATLRTAELDRIAQKLSEVGMEREGVMVAGAARMLSERDGLIDRLCGKLLERDRLLKVVSPN